MFVQYLIVWIRFCNSVGMFCSKDVNSKILRFASLKNKTGPFLVFVILLAVDTEAILNDERKLFRNFTKNMSGTIEQHV